MGVRDVIAKRKGEGALVTREIPGLGTVKIKRLSFAERVTFSSDEKYSLQLVAASACDEEGKLLFASPAEAGQDYAVFEELFGACNAVNGIDVEKAGNA